MRLCEFLTDYNFTDIKYVPGPENVVPDFLSRPWDKTTEPLTIHMLVSAPSDWLSLLHILQRSDDLSVIVMPVWRGQVAVQERQGASGLWSNFLSPGETLLQVAIQVADTVFTDISAAQAMTCVARLVMLSCGVKTLELPGL